MTLPRKAPRFHNKANHPEIATCPGIHLPHQRTSFPRPMEPASPSSHSSVGSFETDEDERLGLWRVECDDADFTSVMGIIRESIAEVATAPPSAASYSSMGDVRFEIDDSTAQHVINLVSQAIHGARTAGKLLDTTLTYHMHDGRELEVAAAAVEPMDGA